MNAGELIGQFIKLRDKKAAIMAAAEAQAKMYTQAMDAIEGAVTLAMDELGVDQLKEQGVGTAFRKRTTSVKVADREMFLDFVFEQRRESFLTSHVSKEAVDEYITENNTPPPGVDVAYIIKTQFRRGDSE